FECVLPGVHCNIWIGLNNTVLDPAYPDEHDDGGTPGFINDDIWYFGYPWSAEGADAEEWDAPDPDNDGYYLPPGYRDWITGEDLLHIQQQFDENIHDKVVNYFGDYLPRPGPLGDEKIQILIFNIRDGLFWDPVNAPWFIMGYYSYYVAELNDANIFHMDSYQWWRRLGDPTEEWYGLWTLPLQYEQTFAHEFQHLVHRDNDYDELSWISEGCSMMAEYLCGYGFSPGHLSEYLIWWWDTSLVIWQNELSNYGAVFLFTFYMFEHYGGAPLIKDLVAEEANGIEGWNNVLKARGETKTFDEIFQDWAIAIYLDDPSICGGIYGYYNLDIGSADTEGYSLPLMIYTWNSWYDWFDMYVEGKYPNYGYNYPYGSQLPYTVNYVEFHGKKGASMLKVEFNGDDYCGIPAYSGTWEWYSDGTSYSWFRLGQGFSIPVTGATLKFMTYYEIEEHFDYGYVEVHDLEMDEWYTLAGIRTTSDLPEPHFNPNCDDGFNPPDYVAAGRWNALTGFSYGWYQEEMELPSEVWGHDIELFFTYWTDPFYLDMGWYIDDIEITNGVFPFDDVESGEGDWAANAGWYRTDGVVDNNFEVNFITILDLFGKKQLPVGTFVFTSSMDIDHDIEFGQHALVVVDVDYIVESYAVMVAANQPGVEHSFATYYEFKASVCGRTWRW
ncbi:MAG: hypothetical protein ACFE9C_16235, partial [Candidatus Hodarchaeota archaeon]